MVKKIILTEEEKDYIKEHYLKGELSISMIAKNLQLDRGVVIRNAKEMGVNKVFPNKTQGKRFEWNEERDDLLKQLYDSDELTVVDIAEKFGISEDTITKRARILDIWKKPKTRYSLKPKDVDFIRDRASSMSIVQIANELGISEDFVSKKIKEMNLTNLYFDELKKKWKLKKTKNQERIELFYLNNKRPGVTPWNDDDFLWDISDPYLTTYDVGEKWNLSASHIGRVRQQLLGKMKATPKLQGSMTQIEKEVSILLVEELDLVYFFEHRIGKWNVDFYLGNKLCIEVQGSYWHASESVKDKDNRKKQELEEMGYVIFYIEEEGFSSKKDHIKKELLGLLQQ